MTSSPRTAANDLEESLLSVNEKIMRDIHQLYTQDDGLVDVANSLGRDLLPPPKKLTVLLTGNHSSGKSSFINWYTGEHCLKTSVAMETQGFSFVTSGKKRQTLKGAATLTLFKRFQGLARFEGVMERVETEVSTSKQHAFPMITLIDTPGLVDGNMVYPYDIDGSLRWMADRVDLVFVFFDPIGQALCSRAMSFVSELYAKSPDKLRFFASKMDSVDSEHDRQNVLIQITQNLTAHIRPTTALRLPTIYIPGPDETKENPGPANGIWDVVDDLELMVENTVQGTIRTLQTDSRSLLQGVGGVVATDMSKARANWGDWTNYFLVKLFVFYLLLCGFLFAAGEFRWTEYAMPYAERIPHPQAVAIAKSGIGWLHAVADAVPESANRSLFIGIGVAGVLLLVSARFWWGGMRPTLTPAQIQERRDQAEFLQACIAADKEFNDRYLSQAVARHEL